MAKAGKAFAIVGPTGSGKQTLASKLVAGMNTYHISWKALLLRADQERFPHEFARILSGEIPVSLRLTLELLREELSLVPAEGTLLFTGIPCGMSQIPVLHDLGFTQTTFIFLEASDSVCKSRLQLQYEAGRKDRNPRVLIEEIYRYRENHPVLLRGCSRVYGSESLRFVNGMLTPDQVYADTVEIMMSPA